MTRRITDNSKVNETLIKQNEILEAKMIRLISENRELNEQLRLHSLSNLLPCPFCGGDVVEEKAQWNTAQALCTDCNEVWGTCGSKYEGRFEKWNVRAR